MTSKNIGMIIDVLFANWFAICFALFENVTGNKKSEEEVKLEVKEGKRVKRENEKSNLK